MESNQIKSDKYSFESTTLKIWKYFPFIRFSINNDRLIFAKRIGVNIDDFAEGSEDKLIFDRFCSANLYNISWYRHHMFRTKAVVIFYNVLSLILLLGVPFLVFVMTKGEIDADSSFDELGKMESIGGGLLVLISSFLGLQKFVGQWIEKRQKRALFNKASIQLKTILYTLQDEFFKKSMVVQNDVQKGINKRDEEKNLKSEYIFSQAFFIALKKATNDSITVINAETQLFFESMENPIFDLGNIWKTSANTAKEVIGAFKSPKFNIEDVQTRAEKEAKQKALDNAKIIMNKKRMEMILIKLKNINNKEERIAIKLEEFDKITATAGWTDLQLKNYNSLESEFDLLEEQSETLELEYQELELENNMLIDEEV